MSVMSWRGRQLEDLTYDELLLAQNQLLSTNPFDYRIGKSTWHKDAMKEINHYIALKQKPKEKVKFYIEQNGESDTIDLYWFEENKIRTYEDLKQAGYSFTIDVGDDVSITI